MYSEHKEDAMNEKEKIQAVINTLEQLMIPATYDNVNRMLGVYQTLLEVRDSKPEEKAVENDG